MILSGTRYQCVAGETWDSVALAVYGDEKHSCDILNANPLLCIVPIFTGGELLNLPIVEAPALDSVETFMPAKAPWKE